MRLHSMRLHGVGPFADEQVIDFDRLAAGGLFLFEGPTGVGKSTILDALTFALYGGLAVESDDPARLRSDFADPSVQPQVQVEFSVRGQRHRITRSPEHHRPKRRGTGMTTEKSSVHLERFTTGGAWESRGHAKDEVGAIVAELLGLNREQFRQVVLLPQGEFATFLRAGDDERRRVLSKLFGTQFFQAVTDGLQVRAQQAARSLQAADAELQARVAAACEAGGLDPDEHASLAGVPVADQLDVLVGIQDQLDRRRRAALLVAQAAAAERAVAARDSAAAEALVALVEQRRELEMTLAVAEAERPQHEQRRARLERARRALPVRPLIELADAAEGHVQLLRAAVAEAAAGDDATPEHLEGIGWKELAGEAASARTLAVQLAHLVLVEDGLVADRRELDERRAVVARLRERCAASRARAGELPEELAAARRAVAQAEGLAAAVPAAQSLLDADTPRAEAAGRVPAMRAEVQRLRAEVRAAQGRLADAEALHGLLLDQRLNDVRVELAARLVSGDPCLVCGSPEHPDPARSGSAGVTAEEVRRAGLRRDEARIELDQAQEAHVRAQVELESAVALAGQRTADQWREHLTGLRDQVRAGEQARSGLPELTSSVSRLEAQEVEVSAQVLALTQDLTGAEGALAHLAADLAARQEQVTTGRGDHHSVRARAASLLARAAELESQSAAVSDLDRGLREFATAVDRARAEAQRAGFADLAEVRNALLSAEELSVLEGDIARWETAVASAGARLASAELRSVQGIDSGSAASGARAWAEELARAETRVKQAQDESAIASRATERFVERMQEVHQLAEDRNRLASSCAEVVDLDRYARGMAGARMSLVTYVLRYWFEQVVSAANVRLATMSAGKYELLRVDVAQRAGARVGLGLSVLDRHTGRERSPGTLSGGESFYTSLSLALGLADVVVAQAGGAQLDTLFIDEGFGSLDPDTLDDVMGVIDELRGNGRVVGIVSHVPELKDRIPERLSVRRIRPDGPSVVQVRA